MGVPPPLGHLVHKKLRVHVQFQHVTAEFSFVRRQQGARSSQSSVFNLIETASTKKTVGGAVDFFPALFSVSLIRKVMSLCVAEDLKTGQ